MKNQEKTSSSKNHTLSSRIITMIERYGSPEERRLVAPHRQALADFLDHPDTLRGLQSNSLDIGLENRLTLKFNLIAGAKRGSPLGMIDQFAQWAPPLAAVSEEVLRHKLHCHAGIKISAEGMEYELYPYETENNILAAGLCAGKDVSNTQLPVSPYCFGFSSFGTLSAYGEVDDVPKEDLENAIGFSLPVTHLKAQALFHSRRSDQGVWQADKAGIEFLPFPSHVMNTVLSHFNLNFSYLLHRGGSRPYGVIGVKGTRQVLYTTLLPKRSKT